MEILLVMRGASMFRGGGETYFFELAEQLVKQGFKVKILTSKPIFRKREIEISSFDVDYIRSPYLRGIGESIKSLAPATGLIGRLMRFVGSRIRVIDLFLFSIISTLYISRTREYDFYLLNGLTSLSWIIKRVGNRKVIVFYPGIPNSWDKKGIALADTVFTDGGGYEELKRLNSKTRLIMNGVDVDRFSGSNKKQYDLVRFLFVGRLVERKDVDYLLSCFKEAELGGKAELDIVGDGPLYSVLKERYKDEKNIIFHGNKEHEEVNDFYGKSHCFLMSSKYDSSPNVIFEAMASGMYVISTKVGGIPNLVKDQRSGILIPLDDKKAYISAIKKVVDDKENFSIYESYNREFIVKNHTWKSTADRFIEMLKGS